MLLPVDSRGHSLGQTPACFVLAPQAADFPVKFSRLSIEFRNFPLSAARTVINTYWHIAPLGTTLLVLF
jgi:hypothetical protein